jgi:hypothetical protein
MSFAWMTTFVIIVASSALPVALSQQDPGVNAKKQPPAITEGPQDPQFQRLEGMAIGCGPEFAVDGLLKVAVLASSQNPKWRARVIEESFVLAGRATVAYATSPFPAGFTDTVPAMTALSSRLQIDRLSLQLRAVRAMLALDPDRARELFDAIPLPVLEPLTCNEFAIPDVRTYYEVLRSVAERGFKPLEIEKGDQEQFIARRILAATSPSQVLPIAALLSDLKIAKPSRQRLFGVFATRLTSIHGDDRSFTFFLLGEDAVKQLQVLVRECRAADASPAVIVDAFRRFYAQHVEARRCSDGVSSQSLRARQEKALENFNKTAREYFPNEPVLKLHESGASFDKVAAPADLWHKSPDYGNFVRRIAEFDPQPDGSRERASDFDQIVKAIDSWGKPEGLEPQEYFIVKSQLLRRLLRVAKDEASYRQVAESYVRFLESTHYVRDTAPALWLSCVIDAVHSREGEGPSRLGVLESALEASNDRVLNLYAALTKAVASAGTETLSR